MLVRQLLIALLQHTEDGRRLDDEVLLKVGNETRKVDASYSDGTFVLIARDPCRVVGFGKEPGQHPGV